METDVKASELSLTPFVSTLRIIGSSPMNWKLRLLEYLMNILLEKLKLCALIFLPVNTCFYLWSLILISVQLSIFLLILRIRKKKWKVSWTEIKVNLIDRNEWVLHHRYEKMYNLRGKT